MGVFLGPSGKENAGVQVKLLLLKDFLWFTFHISERERKLLCFGNTKTLTSCPS